MDFARAYDPIRAFQAAWRLLTRSPLPLLVGGILLVAMDIAWQVGVRLDETGRISEDAVIGALACGGCVGLALFLLSSWITLGLATAVETTITHGRATVGDAFDARGRLFEMVLGRVLVFLIWLGSLIPFVLIGLGAWFLHESLRVPEEIVVISTLLAGLAYLPFWLYLVLGISLFMSAIAIEGLGPTASVRRSWELVRGNRWRLLLYWIVVAVFSLLGICLCCVGIFLTGTLGNIALYESYFALTRGDDYARSWLSTPEPRDAARATIP